MTTATVDDRITAVLQFVLRYGAASIDLLLPLFYPGMSRDSPRKELNDQVAAGLLRRTTAPDGTHYYTATERQCLRLGAHRSAVRGRGVYALATRVGCAWFCARNGFTKLTAREFREQYPELYSRKVPSGFYFLDSSAEITRLGWVEVDTGKDARRLVRRVNHLMTTRFAIPAFAPLIQAGQFYVCCLLPSEGKRQAVQLRLDAKACGALPVRLDVVPEIQTFFLGG